MRGDGCWREEVWAPAVLGPRWEGWCVDDVWRRWKGAVSVCLLSPFPSFLLFSSTVLCSPVLVPVAWRGGGGMRWPLSLSSSSSSSS